MFLYLLLIFTVLTVESVRIPDNQVLNKNSNFNIFVESVITPNTQTLNFFLTVEACVVTIFVYLWCMGLFGSILKTAIDIGTAPIDVVSDVVTLGGSINDTESRIAKKGKTLSKDLKRIKKQASKL